MVDVETALDCLQRGALVVPTELRVIEVTGRDRISWLNGLVTCDLLKLPIPGAGYGLLCERTGKLLAEVFLVIDDATLHLGVPAARAEAIVQHLDRHLIMEDVALQLDESLQMHVALGSNVARLVDAARERNARGGTFRRGELATCAILLAASEDFSAVLGRVSPGSYASDEEWNRIRVEHGIAALGIDFDEKNYPQEAALERDGVSFEKGCYLGQEAVFMLEKRGHVSKRLVQLSTSGQLESGAHICDGDQQIGRVTSFANAATKGRYLALGWVKYKYARAGTELTIGEHPAVVTELLALKNE